MTCDICDHEGEAHVSVEIVEGDARDICTDCVTQIVLGNYRVNFFHSFREKYPEDM